VGGSQNGVNDTQKKTVPTGAAALAKGLRVLDLVADAEEPMRFAELLCRADLPKPTFVRILRTLVAFDLVAQDKARGTYSLGRRFLEMSHGIWDKFDLQAAAVPELERLSRELGETVALCKLDGDEAIYMDERSGDGLAVRVDSGRRVPLYCTAAGKALLAALDPTVARGIFERIDFVAATQASISDPEQLEADLMLTRARSYAVSLEEHLEGVNSVACAVPGQDGNPIGALVALGPSTRFDQSRIHPAGRELIAAARRITGHAGYFAISARPRPRGSSGGTYGVECVLPWGAQLGEAPIWHPEEQKLYWVDILHPAIHSFDPATGVNETCDPGKLVSALFFGRDGSKRVATQDGIEGLDFETGQLTLIVDVENGTNQNRLNDGKTGPGGAIWVGSMRLDSSRPSGGLYRVAPDRTIHRKDSGITVSNGLDWSPDQRTFYFVDTVPGYIYAYDFEPESGELSGKRVLAEVPEKQGRPDGLCVDTEGGIWCAIWDGWCVNRYTPDGRLDLTIDLPVPRPTSVAFGGPELNTLYITSARTRLPARTLAEAPLSGGLLAVDTGHCGLPTFKYL